MKNGLKQGFNNAKAGQNRMLIDNIEGWSQRVSEVFEKMQLVGLIWAVDIIENT